MALPRGGRVATYRYRNSRLKLIWTTQVPQSDEEAAWYFFTVKDFGPTFAPVYVEREDMSNPDRWILLPYRMTHTSLFDEVSGI